MKGKLSFAGHSLGGGLAEANALATGEHGLTFNAAGLSMFTKGGIKSSENVDAYIMRTDPLNLVQGNFSPLSPTAGGNKHFLSPRSLSGIYNGHSIDTIIEALSQPTVTQQLINTLKQALTVPSFLTNPY